MPSITALLQDAPANMTFEQRRIYLAIKANKSLSAAYRATGNEGHARRLDATTAKLEANYAFRFGGSA